MIHEIRTYTLVPGGVREYLEIYNKVGRGIQTQVLGSLVALMTPESGDINQLIFLWAFASLDDRTRRRAELMDDPAFAEFRKSVRHLLVRQDSRLLNAA